MSRQSSLLPRSVVQHLGDQRLVPTDGRLRSFAQPSSVGEEREIVGDNCFQFTGVERIVFDPSTVLTNVTCNWKVRGGSWVENYDLTSHISGKELGQGLDGWMKNIEIDGQLFSPCEQGGGSQIINCIDSLNPANLMLNGATSFYDIQNDCIYTVADILGYNRNIGTEFNTESITESRDIVDKWFPGQLCTSLSNNTTNATFNVSSSSGIIRCSSYVNGNQREGGGTGSGIIRSDFPQGDYEAFTTLDFISGYSEDYFGILHNNALINITGEFIVMNSIQIASSEITDKRFQINVEAVDIFSQTEQPIIRTSAVNNTFTLFNYNYIRYDVNSQTNLTSWRDILKLSDVTSYFSTYQMVVENETGGFDNITMYYTPSVGNISGNTAPQFSVIHLILVIIQEAKNGDDTRLVQLVDDLLLFPEIRSFFIGTNQDVVSFFLDSFNTYDEFIVEVTNGELDLDIFIQENIISYSYNINRDIYENVLSSNSAYVGAYSSGTALNSSKDTQLEKGSIRSISFNGLEITLQNFFVGYTFPSIQTNVIISTDGSPNYGIKVYSIQIEGSQAIPSIDGRNDVFGNTLLNRGRVSIDGRMSDAGILDTNPLNSPLIESDLKYFTGTAPNRRYFEVDPISGEPRHIITIPSDASQNDIEAVKRFVGYIDSPKYSGGTGTSLDPYLISNSDDIIEMMNTPSDFTQEVHFLQTNDINYSVSAALNNLTGHSTIQGGSDTYYDGGGYEIQNLTINNSVIYQKIGFIEVSGNSEIKNVTFRDANIRFVIVTTTPLIAIIHGGALCENVHVRDVNIVAQGTINSLGSLFNEVQTVTRCSTTGDVESVGVCANINEATLIEECWTAIRMRAGSALYGNIATNQTVQVTIRNCYSKGAVLGTSSSFLALILFREGLLVENCYSYSTNFIAPPSGNEMWSVFGNTLNTLSCYQDSDITGITGSPFARTTPQMEQQSNYVGWDFVNVWNPPGPGQYPTLRNNPE